MNSRKYNIYQFPKCKDIVVSGDIHGDFNLLVNKICVQYQMQNTLVIVAGDCGFGFERAGGAAVVIEHNGSIISRDVISDLHTTEFRMMLTLMVKVMQEIPESSDIIFLTNAAYIQNFDKTPTSKSANRTSSESKDASSLAISAESRGKKARANSDLIIQCIEEKKRHKSVGVKIVHYHKSPLLIETHDRATEAMAKTRKEFHQKLQ